VRSPHALPLLVIGLVLAGIMAAIALGIDWLPPAASREAGRSDNLLWFVFTASAVIFVIVVTFLVYSVWKFRAAPGDESDGPPLHGNTTLEIVWTAIPALLLAFLTVYSYLVLSDNEATAKDQLVIDVTGQQFTWSFVYPEQRVQTGILRLPVGEQVKVRLHAKDVIHDFAVNDFRLKADAVPGITNTLKFTPTKLGTYPLVCQELCGLGHSTMRSKLIVMPKAEFATWLAAATAKVKAAK
jgi:cytochrome c oxidase subunit 2